MQVKPAGASPMRTLLGSEFPWAISTNRLISDRWDISESFALDIHCLSVSVSRLLLILVPCGFLVAFSCALMGIQTPRDLN